MDLNEAVAAANQANPDVTVKTATTFEDMPDGGKTVVVAEYRSPTDGKLYAAWHTIEHPERLIERLTRQARAHAAAAEPMAATGGS